MTPDVMSKKKTFRSNVGTSKREFVAMRFFTGSNAMPKTWIPAQISPTT